MSCPLADSCRECSQEQNNHVPQPNGCRDPADRLHTMLRKLEKTEQEGCHCVFLGEFLPTIRFNCNLRIVQHLAISVFESDTQKQTTETLRHRSMYDCRSAQPNYTR